MPGDRKVHEKRNKAEAGGKEGRKKGESPVSRMKRLRKSEILPWTLGNLGGLVTIFYLYELGAAVVPIA